MEQCELNEALFEAVQRGDLSEVASLVQKGANPNAQDHEGITPLFYASGRNGSYYLVQVLVAAGANVHHRCDDGDNPLMWAAYQRNWVELENPLSALLNAGADPDVTNDTPGVPTTALVWAAREGHWSNIKALLEHGADPNLTDYTGSTALHAAAAGGHAQVVELLLKNGADITRVDGAGHTAEGLAAHYCRALTALFGAAA